MLHQFTCYIAEGKKKNPNVLLVCQKCSSPCPNQRSLIFSRLVPSVFHKKLWQGGAATRCPARLSGGGTAALAVLPWPREKHRNAFNKHRVCLMRGLKLGKVQKVPVFYQNTALCMFSALIYIFWKLFFCVSPIPGPVAQAVSGDKRPTAK